MIPFAMILTVLSLFQSGQGTPQTAPPAAAPKPTQLDVRVTDRSGNTLDGARVTIEGPQSREAVTDKSGVASVRLTAAGTYRLHIERTGFITLEKEATVRANVTTPVEAALSLAPPPPAPPPAPTPAPTPPAPTLVAGDPRALSVPDLWEREMIKTETIKETALGCSGATTARMIQLKDTLAAHTHADADETLYVVAGEGTLKIGTREYPLSAAWFAIVPRGAEHSVTRKGKNPLVLVSTVNGTPCGK